jgi:hypothetical protein
MVGGMARDPAPDPAPDPAFDLPGDTDPGRDLAAARVTRRALGTIPAQRRRRLLRGRLIPDAVEERILRAHGRYLLGPLAVVEWAVIGLLGGGAGLLVASLLGGEARADRPSPVLWLVVWAVVWTVSGTLLRRHQGRRLTARELGPRRSTR